MEEIFNDVTWGNIGKDIVPSVFYQAYRVNGAWNGDDESLWYSFEPGDGVDASEIAILIAPAVKYTADELVEIDGVTYVKDEYITGTGTLEDPFVAEEGATEATTDTIKTPAETSTMVPVKANKYDASESWRNTLKVIITASSDLKALYPLSHVFIDGKEFDINVLDNPINFVMDGNHRIVIDWTAELKEVFRVVVNK